MSFKLPAGTLVCQTGVEIPECLAAPIIDRADSLKVLTWDAGDTFQSQAYRRLAKTDRLAYVITPDSEALAELAYACVMEVPQNVALFVERSNAAQFSDLIGLARANGLVVWTEATDWLMSAWLCYDTLPLNL